MNVSMSTQQPQEPASDPPAGYEAPKVTVLGTLAELTQLGKTHTDELLSDGSRA